MDTGVKSKWLIASGSRSGLLQEPAAKLHQSLRSGNWAKLEAVPLIAHDHTWSDVVSGGKDACVRHPLVNTVQGKRDGARIAVNNHVHILTCPPYVDTTCILLVMI